MDLALYTYYIPRHDYDLVAHKVWKQQSVDNILSWFSATNANGLMFLSTCQRVAWIVWGGDGARLNLRHDVACFRGIEARRHLLEVATGLHSANIGDYDILGQLNKALLIAQEAGTVGDEARATIEDILRESKRLRFQLGFTSSSISVASITMKYLTSTLPRGSNVALVGVGAMSSYLAKRLPKLGFRVSVSNRTLSKAAAFGLPVVALSQLQNNPYGFDAIISSTASHVPLFTFNNWLKVKRVSKLLFIDLALPCDSEQSLENLSWVNRVNLDFFLTETKANKLKRQMLMRTAEPLLISALDRLTKRVINRMHRYKLSMASLKLSMDWDILESTAIADDTVLAQLTPDQTLALKALLKRGRTLAFKALYHKK